MCVLYCMLYVRKTIIGANTQLKMYAAMRNVKKRQTFIILVR